MRELRCSPSKRVMREYPIYVGTNILQELLLPRVKSYDPDQVIIITDSTVNKLYGDMVKNLIEPTLPTSIVAMPAGENNKTPEVYLDLCHQVLAQQPTKKAFVVVLGGGVPGNVGGFVASTLMRGLRFAYIPTTVVAQADSSVGGKTGVNTKHGKNLLGLFNDPEFVIIDTQFLKTLPARDIQGGLAECIKHALCGDQDFVNYMLQHLNPEQKYSDEVLAEILFRTVEAKLEVLRYDPKEVNEGKVLLYGHTLGHALETLSSYELNHGEGISIGMMFVAYAALELGLTTQGVVDHHRDLLVKAGLPIDIPSHISHDSIVEQLKYDKKYAKEMELILLSKIGELHATDGRVGNPVTEEFVSQVCKKYF